MQVRSNNGLQQRVSITPLHPWQLIGISDKDYTALVDAWSINEENGTEAASRIKAWVASDRNQDLNLAGLALTSLPPLHADLKKLNAANNQLTSLPAQLPPLVELNVRGNQFKRLPEELPTASLQMLNAVGNKLECVPANFHWLRPGCEIYLEGNILLPDIKAPVGCFLDIDFFYELTLGSEKKCAALLAEFPNAAGCTSSTGESPLLLAVQKSNKELINLLLSHPLTNVNQADDRGITPLIAAIHSRDEDLALSILQRTDIDVNKRTAQGEAVFYRAMSLQLEKVVQVMLARPDIDPSPRDNWGQTAMYCLISKNDLAMFRLLLACPLLNLDETLSDGMSIAYLIAYFGHIEILESLLDKVAVNQERQQKMISAAMCGAAKEGQVAVAALLLRKYRYNPDCLTHDIGVPAIGVAAQNGHIDIVRLLLRFHADPMKQTTNGATPLLLALASAAAGGHLEIVKLLLNVISADGGMDKINPAFILVQSVTNGSIPLTKFLMDRFNITLHDTLTNGSSMLTLTSQYGQPQVLQWLLEQGADTGKPDRAGILPLQRASQTTSFANGMNLLTLLKNGASVNLCGNINEQRKVVYAIGRFVINELIAVSENFKQVEQDEKFDAISMADKKGMQSKAKQKQADAKELLNLLASMKADVLSTVFAAVALSSIEAYDITPDEHPWLIKALDLQAERDPETKGFYARVRNTMQLWDGQGFDGAGQGTFSVLGTRELSRLPPLTRCLRERWGI